MAISAQNSFTENDGGVSRGKVREIDIRFTVEQSTPNPEYRPAQSVRLEIGEYRVTLLPWGLNGRPSAFQIPSNNLWSTHLYLQLHWSDGKGHNFFRHAELGAVAQFPTDVEAMASFNEGDEMLRRFKITNEQTLVIIYPFVDHKNNDGGARLFIEKL